MRKLCLVVAFMLGSGVASAQTKIKTVTPDEALKHRGKFVNVCGIVRAAAPTEKGGKLYFVNAKGEAIWATPILDLASRVGELQGASVCTYGRTYWNLEGLGIRTERVEFMSASGSPARIINDGFPIESPAEIAKPKKKFPWGAVIAAAVVGAAAIGAATSNGTTYYAPPEAPAPPVSLLPPVGPLWIDTRLV